MFEEFKHAFHRYNNAHVQLIIINVVVFIGMAMLYVISQWTGLEFWFAKIYEQFAIPSDFSVFITRPWTILTYAFNHSLSQILHIIFNMLAFYWFGKLFVEYLGSDKLVALYVLGALAGAVLYLLAFNLVPNPPAFLSGSGAMVGASAAIFAVMVGITTLIPDYSFFLLLIGPVKIKYIAAVYIFLSFLGSVGDNAGGDIAHLGGALMGFIYTKQLQSGVNWGSWVTAMLQYIKDLFKTKPKVKVSYRSDQPPVQKKKSGKPLVSQAELDAILDKISAGGYESLTKDEKEKLFNASKKQ